MPFQWIAGIASRNTTILGRGTHVTRNDAGYEWWYWQWMTVVLVVFFYKDHDICRFMILSQPTTGLCVLLLSWLFFQILVTGRYHESGKPQGPQVAQRSSQGGSIQSSNSFSIFRPSIRIEVAFGEPGWVGFWEPFKSPWRPNFSIFPGPEITVRWKMINPLWVFK